MSRIWRSIGVVGGLALALLAGAAYPLLRRGAAAWLSAKWVFPLWFLALIPIPYLVWRMTLGADGRVPRLKLPTLAPLFRGPRGFRTKLRDLPGILRGAALILAVCALARPQDVLRGEDREERGIDIVIVLDLSGSMAAILDGPAPAVPERKHFRRPTRLDTAKDVILDFVARRRTDRIGVVVFGRSAFILSPPTLDKTLLAGLIQKMELGLVDENGTAIGDAVGTGVARLRRSASRSKAIILLTDGDNNAGTIAPEYAATLAKGQGVKIYTVQIGNGDEVEVEVERDLFGQPRYEKRRYPVNPALLTKMAAETAGQAFVANDRHALEQSMHSILDSLEKTRFEAQAATMEDLFPMLLSPAVALLVLEALVRLFLVRRFP